jgi:hypothetical protein
VGFHAPPQIVIPNEVMDLQFATSKTTLQDFLKPLPGELKIPANFREATVEITQFKDIKKAAAA